jgi:hypothetical protein
MTTPTGRRTLAQDPRATTRLKIRCSTRNSRVTTRVAAAAEAASRAAWQLCAFVLFARNAANAAPTAASVAWTVAEPGDGSGGGGARGFVQSSVSQGTCTLWARCWLGWMEVSPIIYAMCDVSVMEDAIHGQFNCPKTNPSNRPGSSSQSVLRCSRSSVGREWPLQYRNAVTLRLFPVLAVQPGDEMPSRIKVAVGFLGISSWRQRAVDLRRHHHPGTCLGCFVCAAPCSGARSASKVRLGNAGPLSPLSCAKTPGSSSCTASTGSESSLPPSISGSRHPKATRVWESS